MVKCFIACILILSLTAVKADGKILATPGVAQVEGAGGGGLTPWAMLGSYATEDEISGAAHCTTAGVDDFDLTTCGAQLNVFDKFELTFARQSFDVLPLGLTLEQDIFGVKYKLYGDVVYSVFPQVAIGAQLKDNKTPAVPFALGADDDRGQDYYVSFSKLHLGAVVGYNLLWNATVRYTSANEMGLLGFGSASDGSQLQSELSAAILFNKHLAVGTEYRSKPDNLGLGESDWKDVFIAWFPNKHVSVTAAYIDLGTIAGLTDQTGWYLSVVGYY